EILVACEAELYNETEIGDIVGDVSTSPGAETAARLAGLYERYGTAFLEKVRGDFSVILWDRRQQAVFAATDGFGIHPLVHYEDESVLLVASRIDALLASGEVSTEINPRALA